MNILDLIDAMWIASSPLRRNKEIIGAVLRTKSNVKPVFVSIGHKIRLDDAMNICICATNTYRLPEPTRLADRKVAELKRTGAIFDGA